MGRTRFLPVVSNALTLVIIAAYVCIHVGLRLVEERNAAYVREEMLAHLYSDELHQERIKIQKHHSVETYEPSTDYARTDRRIMITGLSRDVEEVKDSIWESFRSYCKAFDASVHIQTKVPYDYSGTAENNLKDCMEVIITSDLEATAGVTGISDDSWEPLNTWGLFRKLGQRVQRITMARQGQLAHVRDYVAERSLDAKLDAILVVDLDMKELPSAESLRPAVDAVGLSGKWDAICADGLDTTGSYYDTFATIVKFATFMTLPVHPYFRPLIHDADGFTYYYSWLMRRFQVSLEGDARRFVPVRSCFGGMAIYRAQQIVEDSCSYRWSDAETDNFKITAWNGKGEVLCEHVRMHLCLENRNRERGRQFNIGISKTLKTRWKGEDE